MLTKELERIYPSAKLLVREKVASRIAACDSTLYDFCPDAEACAQEYMGWATLATNPPYPYKKILAAVRELRKGLDYETVLLIGQGGSTQAPMTITKYNKCDREKPDFKVMDSVSPVRVRTILQTLKPERTVVVVSSKSGNTIEMRSLMCAIKDHFSIYMAPEKMCEHLIAITDPGSYLEQVAKDENWKLCFTGEPTVGGRFSALSVFGLVPAALSGINMDAFMGHAKEAEMLCSSDCIDNPAITLASFLYDNYRAGRDKFTFLTPKRGRVMGLWIEQLVAESLGKNGLGILPNIEIDPLNLSKDPGDRTIIVYDTKTDLWDERCNFDLSLAYLSHDIPRMDFSVDNVSELAEHFVMWEYAIAMCGYLMKICPFDQPDVASTKAAALKILAEGMPEPTFKQVFLGDVNMGDVEITMAPGLESDNIHDALKNLFGSLKPGDYFALDAFLPYDGEGRREALEYIRHSVAKRFSCASCLEIGPRYLHSTGQLQKGGTNNGVFLILSADEVKDIPLHDLEADSLGALAKAQAAADLTVMIERGRRCMHMHLPDNAGVTLRALSECIMTVLNEL